MSINKIKYNNLLAYGFGFAAMLFTFAACSDFDELNKPEGRLIIDDLNDSNLGQAFAQSQYITMHGPAFQFQVAQSLFGDIYSQYFALINDRYDSDMNFQVMGWTDSFWNSLYGDGLPQLHFVETTTSEKQLELENALAKVWRVQAYHRITDYWGPIIYSDFGNSERTVHYDSQEEIYMDFFDTLDEAVAVLRNGGSSWQSDLLYRGNIDQWEKFANSLRLRLALRIAYVNEAKAQAEAEKAVAAGVFENNSDNAMLLTTSNSDHPHTTITAWGDFRMSASMESILMGYDDPRTSTYFNESVLDGGYKGLRNGIPREDKSPPDMRPQYSDIGDRWQPSSRGGNTPIRVMSAAEVYFLRAEGALRGWNMEGNAQELYEMGIWTSMKEDRIGASDDEIDAYVNSMSTPATVENWPERPDWQLPIAASEIPVAWENGAGFERNLEQIATQKWLALYPDGIEAWAEVRRTGYPRLFPRIKSLQPEEVPANEIMSRLKLVGVEETANPEGYEAAQDLIGGPDENSTKVWWDAKEN